MVGTYPHFISYVRLYHEKAAEYRNKSETLFSRMSSGIKDESLRYDLSVFYKECYRAPYSMLTLNAEGQFESPVAALIKCLELDRISQGILACWCHVSPPSITKWKQGALPSKYRWWLVALHTSLSIEYMPSFLMVAGYVIDPFCRQDMILLHGQRMGYSITAIEEMLTEHRCPIDWKNP